MPLACSSSAVIHSSIRSTLRTAAAPSHVASIAAAPLVRLRSMSLTPSAQFSQADACREALSMSPAIHWVTYSRGSGPPIEDIRSQSWSNRKPKLTSGSWSPLEVGAGSGYASATSANPSALPSSMIRAPPPNSCATDSSVRR
jgi:hypothetical protein